MKLADFKCHDCGHIFEEEIDNKCKKCPECKSNEVMRQWSPIPHVWKTSK